MKQVQLDFCDSFEVFGNTNLLDIFFVIRDFLQYFIVKTAKKILHIGDTESLDQCG